MQHKYPPEANLIGVICQTPTLASRVSVNELLASLGQDESGLDQLARIGFDTLGLQTYLTDGPKEARAWAIHKGLTAPQAAGKVRMEGKDYVMKDGDVVEFRFNV